MRAGSGIDFRFFFFFAFSLSLSSLSFIHTIFFAFSHVTFSSQRENTFTYTDFLSNLFLDGFFDSGMLQAALKAKHEQQDALAQSESKEVVRRNIGRRLKLADY